MFGLLTQVLLLFSKNLVNVVPMVSNCGKTVIVNFDFSKLFSPSLDLKTIMQKKVSEIFLKNTTKLIKKFEFLL